MNDASERFSRFEAMTGAEGMARLRRCHILVFGIGGVGGSTVEALARAGVCRLTLVDDDEVDITNLNRQLVSLSSNIGQKKAETAAARVRDINPDCTVRALTLRLTPENGEGFFREPVDYVADCIDDMNAKTALIELCRERDIPLISCMGAGNRWDPSKLKVTDLFRTQNDPVARILRGRLRKLGIDCLTVVASDELPMSCRIETAPGRFSPASSPFVPPAAGVLMASHIVRTLLGKNTEKK